MTYPGRPSASTVLLAVVWLMTSALPARALDPAQPLREYGQQLWQTDNGLPQNTVHAIRQTQDGYIWLATDGGLVRFDGIDFTLFDKRSAPAMRSNLIGALAETGDGTLWAATADGLLRRGQGSLQTLGAANGLPAGPIADVLPADADHLWAISPEHVAYGAGDRFTLVSSVDAPRSGPEGMPIAAVAPDGSLWLATTHNLVHLIQGRIVASLPIEADAIAIKRNGDLWLTSAKGLMRYQRDTLTLIPLAGSAAGALHTTALCVGRGDTVYIATSRGLAILAAGATTWKTNADGLPANPIVHLYEDRQGALWLSSEDAVVRYAQGRFETLHARSGAAGIQAFFEDLEGNLWLGTDAAGLLELREQRFTTYTTADGLPGDVIRTLFADKNGSIWAGTDGSGLTHLQGSPSESTWQTLTTRQGLASNTILSLAAQRSGAIAVGTPDGLDRLQDGHASPAARGDVLPDDFVRSLLYDPADNSLWIGTRRGLAHQTATGVTIWNRSKGLGSDLVGALALDRTRPGALWVGTRGGLSHLEAGRITTLTVRDGLSSDVITALYQDANGALWIGTNGGGLSLLRDGHVSSFPTAASGLPEVIHSIVEDGRSNLWLGAATGIYRVARQQLDAFASHTRARIDVAAYSVADGMRINECSSGHPAAARTPDGELWFATLRGISVTNPERLEENRLPPPVVIENVTVDDQPASDGAGVTIGPSHTRLSLHYAGLSYVAPTRVHYRYRLLGFDPNWIDAGTRRIAYYTNIPPGHYTFRVLAANNDGVWNDSGATVDIHVLPHTWQTWWFRTLFGLVALLLGYQIYRMRVRNVELRFNAVLAERTRIAREIHDTLAQDIVGISVQLELVSRLLGSSVDAARIQLDATRALVKNSLAEARSSIWNLRSAAAGADDLPARVNRTVTQAAANGPAKLRFQVRGTYRGASSDVEDQLLRVAQEAVTNALRHSSAATINVTLRYDIRTVELTIEDDGCGFTYDPAAFAEGGHFGVQGMQERATAIGGLLQVWSQPGRGSRISLRVDIP